jgi:hypothetical protein
MASARPTGLVHVYIDDWALSFFHLLAGDVSNASIIIRISWQKMLNQYANVY